MTETATKLQSVTADDLMSKTFPPAEFVVPEVLPVGLTLLAGRPKLGKSWLCLDMAVAIATGGTVLGQEAAQGSVLYLALEDGPRRLQDRLSRMLGGAVAPACLHLATECPALDDGGDEALGEWAGKADKPLAIIVDVFQRIRAKPKGGDRLYADDYTSVLPLKAIADELNIAVVCVVHTRKAEAVDPFDLISATTGLVGAADHALILDRGSIGLTLYGRGRDVAEFDLALKLDPATMRFGSLGDRDAVHRSDTRNSILAAFSKVGEPIGPSEIARLAGVDANTVKQRLRGMAKSGEVIKHARGLYGLPTMSEVVQ